MRSPLLRRVFSFPTMLASILLVLAVLTVRSRFDDPDLWWNLKTGEVIWTTHTIPVTDLFSYTTNHHAWIPHEWLAQVVIYAAYKFGGYSGLMFLLCLLTVTLVWAGYALCTLYSGNSKVSFVGAMIVWIFATVGFSIRAQMIGYIFLILELLIIQLGRTRSSRWFFCLPVLFALWVNCHASFILGLALGVVLWGASFVSFDAGEMLARRWEPLRRRTLALALVLSGAALFLNPVGLKLILYPVDTMLHMPVLVGNVAEYAPLRMTEGRGVALMAVLLCSFLLPAMDRAFLYWDELAFLAIGAWMAVSHMRMLIVFGILAGPILSRQLSKLWEGYDAENDRPALNAAFIAVALVVAYVGFPNKANLQQQVEDASPVKALEFARANHLRGPMLNDHGYGGYLLWAAPEYPVFLDGRTDVFEWTGVLREFGNWATLQSDPNALLEKYKIGFCLLDRTSPMARVLPLLPGWKLVYSDNNAVIIARTSTQANAG
ncbi:MAG TPA: hypothetical protein VGG56_10420 [Terracidiphilus sp.]